MEAYIKGLTSLFSQSLEIVEPWYIRSIETQDEAVHIYVDIREGNMMPCPECGVKYLRAGYEKQERVWRHGDVMFYPCYVHCRRPRIKCKDHGIIVVDAPWARKFSRFTMQFEGYAMVVLQEMPILPASELLRCNEKSLTRILRYWVGEAVDEDDLSDVTDIGIDETSFLKGQSYVTVVVDANKKRVIDVEPGRTEQTVIDFSYKLMAKGGDCNNILNVSSDMSKAYKNGIEISFPYAKITIDKFHVKQLLLKAMDEVRKEEQKEYKGKVLFQSRKLLYIPETKQSEQQRLRITEISSQYPKTGRAFRMVQALDLVYASEDIVEASKRFDALFRWLRRSRLEPMKKVAMTLKEHKTEILYIFKSKLTNAICEGINSLIQAAKRKARGYHTFEGYSSMIHLIAGKLQLACPNPLRQLE